jgi:glucosylceramidase
MFMKKYFKRNFYLVLCASTLFIQSNCTKNSTDSTTNPIVPAPMPTGSNDVAFYLTKADQSVLLQQQSGTLSFGTVANNNSSIDVDSTQTFQTVDGFGYTLTGGSAYLINGLPNADKTTLLNDLFSTTSASSIGISYLRVSLGASDLSTSVFSYNDLPAGQTDVNVANFSLAQDTIDVIPILKQIIAINPNIKIMASPWSAPTWMKDNNNSIGGSLQTQYYAAYAKYFVKYIQTMKAAGITIDAVTIQNEPEYGGNNPSMFMTAIQQANFIKNNLGPAFAAAAITTKIIVFDHNCDNANYPISIMNDAAAKPYVNGAAFHLYGGNISAMNTVHNAHPDKNLYFTEQWTGANGAFDVDFKWNLKNVVMGSMQNWSKVALQWNLASSPTYTPHTNGGCTECKGALTINGLTVSKNVAYFTIAQVSKFVPSGSVRIQSSGSPLSNICFLRQDGKKVLIVLNEGATSQTFNLKYKGKWVVVSLPANAAGTYVW